MDALLITGSLVAREGMYRNHLDRISMRTGKEAIQEGFSI